MLLSNCIFHIIDTLPRQNHPQEADKEYMRVLYGQVFFPSFPRSPSSSDWYTSSNLYHIRKSMMKHQQKEKRKRCKFQLHLIYSRLRKVHVLSFPESYTSLSFELCSQFSVELFNEI